MGKLTNFFPSSTAAEYFGREITRTFYPHELSEDALIVCFLLTTYVEDKYNLFFEEDSDGDEYAKPLLEKIREVLCDIRNTHEFVVEKEKEVTKTVSISSKAGVSVEELVQQIKKKEPKAEITYIGKSIHVYDLYRELFFNDEQVKTLRFRALEEHFKLDHVYREAKTAAENNDIIVMETPDLGKKAQEQTQVLKMIETTFGLRTPYAKIDKIIGDMASELTILLNLVSKCSRLNRNRTVLEALDEEVFWEIKNKYEQVKAHMRKSDLMIVNFTLTAAGEHGKRGRIRHELEKILRA